MSLKEVFQPSKLLFFELFCHIRINTKCGSNIRVTQSVLNNFYIYTRFAHPCRECVAQRVAAKVRQQYGIFLSLMIQQHLIIAIPSNSPNRLVNRPLMIGIAIFVQENEIRVTIDGFCALNIIFLLVSFSLKMK